MGKTGKNLKRKRLENESSLLPIPSTNSPTESDATYLAGLLTPQEVAIATKTLKILSTNPELLKAKNELKLLRGAAFDYIRINSEQSGEGNGISSRISSALGQGRYLDATVLLHEMRARALKPKLGAIQRWVRDCDAASSNDGSYGDSEILRALEAILRSTSDVSAEPVLRQPEFVLRPGSGDDLFNEVQEGKLPLAEEKIGIAKKFRLLQSTPGPERLPPNLHPALLFTSAPSTITLSPILPSVTRHEVPNVPGAFILADILSKEECRNIVAAAEAVGFSPDQPVSEAKNSSSVLAHNLYWLADSGFMKTFQERVMALLPQEIEGVKLTGINSRFRVYRYLPGAIYRPHIDGAWPKSGLAADGTYLYDSALPDEKEWSRFTFLLYLNDGFEGGNTTFFLPSNSAQQLDAFGVKPIAGCALVFPHGDAVGSLLHEGSPVIEGSGGKYVIRTEVLYTTKTI